MNINNIDELNLVKAKRTDNGQWITGNIIRDGVTGQYFIHSTGNSVNESDKVEYEGCLSFTAFEIDPLTICHCTGKRDKNGVLAFEGDIAKSCLDDLCPKDEVTETIVWNGLSFFFVENGCEPDLIMPGDIERCEIIGNVHDNASNTQSAVINDNTEIEPTEDDEFDKKAVDLLVSFIGQCGGMAEENWCPSQVDMLKRLFGAVLKGVPYAEWEPDERNEEYLKSELDELYETCSRCPHENDLGKEACDGCGINSSIWSIRMELQELEE